MRFPRLISEWIRHRPQPSSVPQPQRRRRILQLVELEERVLYSAAPLEGAVLQPDQNPDAAAANANHDAVGPATPTVDVVLATHEVSGDVGSATLEPVSVDADGAPHDDISLLANVPADSTASHHTHELVFVDANIEHSEQLLQSLGALGDPSRQIEVVVLSPDRDGIEQISDALATHDHLDAVHVLSHSTDGAVKLGANWLHSENLDAHAGAIAQWHDALSSDADILFYGCDLAASTEGQVLLDGLHALTGADIAASSNATGSASFGGDWNLEATAGLVEATPLFSNAHPSSWEGLLDSFTVTNTNNSGAGSLRQAILDANSHSNGLNPGGVADTITFNIAGVGPHTVNVMSALPTIDGAVFIDGWSEPDFAGMPVIELNGSSSGAGVDGLHITAGGSTVRGLVINHFSGDGIELAVNGGNTIVGNIIGLDPTGTIEHGNGEEGVNVYSGNNIIGGLSAAERNILSGNGFEGVALQNSAAFNNVVHGNYIGTDVTGTLDRGNTLNGVWIGAGANNNLIGGTVAGARNVIAGNDDEGIEVAGSTSVNNVVQGNYIGVTAAGNAALANGDEGILIENAVNTLIGGSIAGAGNVIGGNLGNGIVVGGGPATGNTIQGNFIGTDATGTLSLGNSLAGIHFSDASEAATGGAKNTTVGGTTAGAGNTIRFNIGDGVWVESSTATGNSLSGNSISSNGGLGIDLGTNGITANDLGDGDGGANNLQNFPVLATAVASGGSTTLTGTFNSTASATFHLEFFSNPVGGDDSTGYGEGSAYLGTTSITTDGLGNASVNVTLPVSVAVGELVTATATVDLGGGSFGSTSEFAQNVVVAITVNDDLAPVSQFRVNSTTANAQHTWMEDRGSQQAVAIDSSGNYVVVWSSQNQDGSGWDAFGQRYNRFGVARGGEFQINQFTAGDQYWANVAVAPNGGFVAAWTSQNQDGSGSGVYARSYDPDGNAFGNEFQVNTVSLGDQKSPSVGMDAAGNSVVVWQGNGTGDSDGVFSRRFDAAGTPLDATEQRVNTNLFLSHHNPAVSMNDSGQYAVVWDNNNGVFVRRFDSAGAPVGSVITVDGDSDSGEAAVALDNDGDFVVTWRDKATNLFLFTDESIVARRYNAAGAPLGSAFAVSTSSGDQYDPSITMGSAGDFLIVWEGDGGGDTSGVFGRKYTATGSAASGEFRINQITSGTQDDASVAMTDLSNFVVVWSGNGPGDTNGVFARQYGTSPGNQPPTANPGGPYTIGEGGSLELVGTGSSDPDNQPLTYDWDLDNDGVFGDVSGDSPTVGWATLQSFGIDDDGMYVIGLRVDDGFGSIDTATSTLTVANTPPTAVDDTGTGFTTDEDTSLTTTSVVANDTDPAAGDSPLVVSLDVTSTLGLVTDNGNGTFKYDPNGQFESLATGQQATDTFHYTVSDGDGGTATATVTITIDGVNDMPVITSNGGGATASVSVAENTTAVTTVTAADADLPAQTLSYAISGGADAAKFTIDATTGALSFVAAQDFENPTDTGTNNVYNVAVQVSDGAGGTDTQTISVVVSAVNDNNPVITSCGGGATASVSVSENTTAVTTVTTTDADLPAQTLSYAISGGADAAKFTINSTTGALSFSSAQDFENPTDAGNNNVYDITVQVSDGAGGTDTQAISVTVTDVNDSPVITSNGGGSGATAAVSVAENTTAVTTVTATDADLPAQTLSYSITGGGDKDKFAIDATTGALSFVTAPDFENPTDTGTNNVYHLTIKVSDGAGGNDTQAIHVTVTEVNDSPVITTNGGGATASVSVAENTIAVTTVAATDADLPAQTLSYAIFVGADAAKFTIDATTGALSFVSAQDFENPTDTSANNVYDVAVQVSDGNGRIDTQAISVTVTNVDEFDVGTIIDSDTATNVLNENAANGTLVGLTGSASDADATNNTITYSLDDSAGGRFAINSSTGVVSVAGAVDREAAASHSITVRATSADGSFATQIFTINVDDVDEFDVGPISDADATANSVAENAGLGMTVGITAIADDADGSDTENYSLDDDAGGRFAINAATGVVTVSGVLDYETTTSHTIVVRGISTDGSFSTQNFTINVTDGNEGDITGVSDIDAVADAVAENVAAGATVAITAFATDPDLTDTVSYSLDDDAAGRFAINGTTGAVTVSGGLDYETTTSHTIVVRATSTDGSFSTRGFTINLIDMDEFDVSPISDTNGAAESVAENAAAATTIGVTAFADDADGTDTVSYALDDDAGGRFTINATTGVITVSASLNFEAASGHTIVVRAASTDGSFSTQTFTIILNDVDEFDVGAVSDTDAAANAVNENAANGTVVGIAASASDADATTNAITYSLDDNADGRFAINGATGVVTVANGTLLDREAAASHIIVARASSVDGSFSTQSFTINVDDIDEFDVAAVSDTDAAANAVNENAANGTAVGITAFASDADATDNIITYSLDDDASGRFAIHATTGVVTVADGTLLDRESVASHNIILRATGSDGTFSSQALSITVRPVNDNNPVFTSLNSASVAEHTTAVLTLTATDADLPAQSLTYSIGGGTDAARFVINATTGVLTFVTSPDFENPTDADADNVYEVQVTADDGAGGTTSQPIRVAVTPVSEAPVATGDSYFVNEDATLNVAAAGVLTNDSDMDGDPLSAVLVSGPSSAAAFSFNADGSFSYTPIANFNGADSFTYRADDGTIPSNLVTVTITVVAVNDAPLIIVPGTQSTSMNIPVVLSSGSGNLISVTDVDAVGDSVEVKLDAKEGTLTLSNTTRLNFSTGSGVADAKMVFTGTLADINAALDGLVFTPKNNYAGNSANIKITADDLGNTGTGGAAMTTNTVGISFANEAPVAMADSYLTSEDNAITAPLAGVLGNDTDNNGNQLTAVLVSGPTNAAAFSLNADGSFSYTPNADFSGIDSFTYKANDGSVDSNVVLVTITVTITVNPVIDLPGPVTSPTTNPLPIESGDDLQPVIETPPIKVGVDVDVAPTSGGPGPQAIPRITTEIAPPPVRPSLDDLSQESPTPTLTVSVFHLPARSMEPSENTLASLPPSEAAAQSDPSSGSDDLPYAHLQRPGAFWKGLDEMRRSVDDEVHTQTVFVGAALATASGLSAGYVIWLARSGVLLTSLMAQLPSWRSLDPLVILDYADDRRSKNPRDDETLEDVIATPSFRQHTS